MTERIWEGRLNQRGARLVPAIVAPGQEYWFLVEARWLDKEESRGLHHIFMEPVDLPCRIWWPDGEDVKIKDYPMYSAGTPYNIQPDTGIPADAVHGLGMGTIEQPDYDIHTSYRFRWEKRVAGPSSPTPEPQTLEQRVAALEEKVAVLWSRIP